MEIINLTQENFELYKDELIEINDAFLVEIDSEKERTQDQKEAILKNMIKTGSPTRIFIGITKEKKMAGMTYFNVGTGYSCGGDYLWLNSIYIRPEEQKKGYGTMLLNAVEKWAKENKITLFVSSRDKDNDKSKKLFNRLEFKQSEMIWMNKIVG